MTKCKELPLDDIVTMIDYRGKTPKKSTSGIPLITAKIIKNGRIYTPTEFISEDEYVERMTRGFPQIGDILITTEAPLGEVAELRDAHVAMGQRIITMHANKNLICGKYLKYYLLSHEGQSKLRQRESGTTVTGIKQAELRKVLIPLPPLYVQQRISRILDTLDDKIELNEKINQNLESQAQAIFKSWFVDFEPFGGKMPADWKSGTFSELITNTVGGDWGKDELQDNYTEEVYCIRGADIPDVKIGNRGKMPKRYILQKNYSLKKLNDGDLVVEISGGSPTQSTGRIAAISDYLLNRYKNKIICTNFCKSLKPRKNYSEYVYHYWQYLYDKNIFFGYENGTTGIKNLDISAFLETEPVIIPSQNILVAFAEVCRKTFAQIYHNGYENETLAQLRDTLLPKLMSGEIDVSDVAV